MIDKAKAALPEGDLSWTYLPTQLDTAFAVDKLRSDESNRWRRSTVFLDQYSGKVLAIHDAYQVSLAEFLNVSTLVLHNGAYGGAFTRILYVFVGLAPTILLSTGFMMWRYRRRAKPKSQIFDRPTNQHRD